MHNTGVSLLSDEDIETIVRRLQHARALYKHMVASPKFKLAAVVAARANVTLDELVVDYDLLKRTAEPNDMLDDAISTVLNQASSTHPLPDVGDTTLPSQSSVINLSGLIGSDTSSDPGGQSPLAGTGGSPPPMTGKGSSPPRTQESALESLVDALEPAASLIAGTIVDTFGNPRSVHLNALRQQELIPNLVYEYQRLRQAPRLERLLRRKEVYRVQFTPEFEGLLAAAMRQITYNHRQLHHTVLSQYLPDADVRTDLGELVGEMKLERAALLSRGRSVFMVTHTRITRAIEAILARFRYAIVTPQGIVVYQVRGVPVHQPDRVVWGNRNQPYVGMGSSVLESGGGSRSRVIQMSLGDLGADVHDTLEDELSRRRSSVPGFMSPSVSRVR